MSSNRLLQELSRLSSIEPLTEDVKKSINDLLTICVKIHSGIPVKGYSNKDLPSDELYEHFKSLTGFDESVVTTTPIMIMSTIKKSEVVTSIDNALILPKFDGCSIAMRFVKDTSKENSFDLVQAHTRGTRLNTITHHTQDVTDKIKIIIPSLTIDTDTNTSTSNKSIKDLITDLNEICIRGELVNNFTQLDSSNRSINAPASEVSGKINSNLTAFIDYSNKMTIQGYEISKLTYTNGDTYVPDQMEVMNILNSCFYSNSYESHKRVSDYEFINRSTNDLLMSDIYKNMVESNTSPIDGVVYCDCNWRYPSDVDKFNSVDYGKTAWKPSNECLITVTSLDTTIGTNGEIQFQISFKPVIVSGKKYSKASVGLSKLRDLLKSGLGYESSCLLEVRHNIIPYVSTVVSQSTTPFELPTMCPSCNHELDVNDLHIVCTNKNCSSMIVVKYTKFIKLVNQYSNHKLTFLNDKKKQIKSSIGEKKLIAIKQKHNNQLTLSIVTEYIPNLMDVFNNDLSLENQLHALQVGGIKDVKKLIKEMSLTSLDDYISRQSSIWLFD